MLSLSKVVLSISRATKREDCNILNFSEFKAICSTYLVMTNGSATHEQVMAIYQEGKSKGYWSCSKFDKEAGEEPALFINVSKIAPQVEETKKSSKKAVTVIEGVSV